MGRFYPSSIKKIANEVLSKYLEGKDYDEDASKEWVVAMCDEVKRRTKGKPTQQNTAMDNPVNLMLFLRL
jgi:ribosomal protein S17E